MCSNFSACVRRSFERGDIPLIEDLLLAYIGKSFGEPAAEVIRKNYFNAPLGVFLGEDERRQIQRMLIKRGLIISAPPATGKSFLAKKKNFVDIDLTPEMQRVYNHEGWNKQKSDEEYWLTGNLLRLVAVKYKRPNDIVFTPAIFGDFIWLVPKEQYAMNVKKRRAKITNKARNLPFEEWYEERSQLPHKLMTTEQLIIYLYGEERVWEQFVDIPSGWLQTIQPQYVPPRTVSSELCRIVGNRGLKHLLIVPTTKFYIPGVCSLKKLRSLASNAGQPLKEYILSSPVQIILDLVDPHLDFLTPQLVNVVGEGSITVPHLEKYIVRMLRGDSSWRYTNLTWWGLKVRFDKEKKENPFLTSVEHRVEQTLQLAALESVRQEVKPQRQYEVFDFQVTRYKCGSSIREEPEFTMVRPNIFGFATRLGFVATGLRIWLGENPITQWDSIEGTQEVIEFVRTLKNYTARWGKNITLKIFWGEYTIPSPLINIHSDAANAIILESIKERVGKLMLGYNGEAITPDFVDSLIAGIARDTYGEIEVGSLAWKVRDGLGLSFNQIKI